MIFYIVLPFSGKVYRNDFHSLCINPCIFIEEKEKEKEYISLNSFELLKNLTKKESIFFWNCLNYGKISMVYNDFVDKKALQDPHLLWPRTSSSKRNIVQLKGFRTIPKLMMINYKFPCTHTLP